MSRERIASTACRTPLRSGGARRRAGTLSAGLLLAACGSSSSQPPAAPSALSYPTTLLRVPAGAFAPELVPALEGGRPDAFAIAPGLPPGLELAADGTLRGLPVDPLPRTPFTITASNERGSVSTELFIEVDEAFAAPRFLYVSNYEDHTLSVFVAGPGGELRHHGYAAADPKPSTLAAAPNGHHLYSGHPSGRITVYRVDPRTGRPARAHEVETGAGILDLVLDPTGAWLVAAHAGGLGSFRARGADDLRPAGGAPGVGPVSLALHPDGRTLYGALFETDAIGAYSLEPATGALEVLEIESAGSEPTAVLVHPNGVVLYAAHGGAGELGVYAIEAGGRLRAEAAVPAGVQPVDLSLDADATRIFVTDLEGEAVLTFDVDASGLVVVPDESRPAATAPFALERDGTGAGVYVTHLDTSDVGHWVAGPDALAERNRVRTRGGATDCVLLRGPTPLAFQSSHAFTANRDFGDVSTLAVDGESGLLTDLGQPVSAGGDPLALSFDPNAGRLYSATGSGVLAQFSLGSQALTDLASPVFAGDGVRSIAVDPTGRFVFAVGTGGLASFEIAGSELVPDDALFAGPDPSAIAVDPGGLYLYVLNPAPREIHGFWIHGVTGRVEPLEGSPWTLSAADPSALAVHPAGRFLYVADELGGAVAAHAIGVDGALSALPAGKVVQAPSHLALAPDGRWLFGTSFTRSEVTLCRVDRLTGALETTAVHGALAGPGSVHVDVTGRFAYVADPLADQVSVFAVDGEAGALEKVQDVALGAGAAPTAVVTGWKLVEE